MISAENPQLILIADGRAVANFRLDALLDRIACLRPMDTVRRRENAVIPVRATDVGGDAPKFSVVRDDVAHLHPARPLSGVLADFRP